LLLYGNGGGGKLQKGEEKKGRGEKLYPTIIHLHERKFKGEKRGGGDVITMLSLINLEWEGKEGRGRATTPTYLLPLSLFPVLHERGKRPGERKGGEGGGGEPKKKKEKKKNTPIHIQNDVKGRLEGGGKGGSCYHFPHE